MSPAPRLLASDLAALPLLPLSVLAGGALFWPAACLVAVAAALERRHAAMLAWYGLAVGFDPQALLLAPFFVAVLIGRRVTPALLPVAPSLALAMLLLRTFTVPGAVPGAPELPLPQDLALSAGAPTVWAIAAAIPWLRDLPLTGLALTTALGVAAAYVAYVAARPPGPRALLDAALLCALVMPGVMPAIGTEGFWPACGLALLLAVDARSPARLHVAGLTLAGLALAPVPGALAMIAATVLHARAVFGMAANDNPLMARTARTRSAA